MKRLQLRKKETQWDKARTFRDYDCGKCIKTNGAIICEGSTMCLHKRVLL